MQYLPKYICSNRFTREASKPADAQTGLADIVDPLANKPEWGRYARMKMNDSAGQLLWRGIEPYHLTTSMTFFSLRQINLLYLNL